MATEIEHYKDPSYKIELGHGEIVGRHPTMKNLFMNLNLVSKNDGLKVLISGQTGTGKELCANAIHYNGYRAGKHFVRVNCGAFPPELLEAELFGYVKGAFTGAFQDTPGKLEHAHEGTILLDEIGEMPHRLQVKLLRVLQDGYVTRIGANTGENLDFRVISSTNKNLEEEIKFGRFREDLYYRINEYAIEVPTLGERSDDINLLARYFISKLNNNEAINKRSRKKLRLSPDAGRALKSHEWRGNIRELETVIEKAYLTTESGNITPTSLKFGSSMPQLYKKRPSKTNKDELL